MSIHTTKTNKPKENMHLFSLSLSLSLSITHAHIDTHTHTYIYIYILFLHQLDNLQSLSAYIYQTYKYGVLISFGSLRFAEIIHYS